VSAGICPERPVTTEPNKGNVALVTGAGRGIGKALALGFAAADYRAVVIARTASEIADTAEEIKGRGGEALAICADVSELNDVRRVAATLEERFGRLDVLVNNAALRMNHLGKRDSYTIPFEKLSIDDWDRAIRVNLRGPFLCIKELLPLLQRAGRASIINVSAGGGKRGMPGRSPYCASKFGLEGLTQCLAIEFRAFNIAVNTISPGAHSILTDREKIDALKQDPAAVYMRPEMMIPPTLFLAKQDGSGTSGQHVDALQWNLDNGLGNLETWRAQIPSDQRGAGRFDGDQDL
jgi:NAD(P)-dependent dehydrogenase (short-subunit alcohol dehydrogenase family)